VPSESLGCRLRRPCSRTSLERMVVGGSWLLLKNNSLGIPSAAVSVSSRRFGQLLSCRPHFGARVIELVRAGRRLMSLNL